MIDKVLVTGGNGYLGMQIILAFKSRIRSPCNVIQSFRERRQTHA